MTCTLEIDRKLEDLNCTVKSQNEIIDFIVFDLIDKRGFMTLNEARRYAYNLNKYCAGVYQYRMEDENLGWTALHCAREVEIAKLLIEAGADINAKGNFGTTPLGSVKSSLRHEFSNAEDLAKVVKFLEDCAAKKPKSPNEPPPIKIPPPVPDDYDTKSL